mgnify:CR=1 FL=1
MSERLLTGSNKSVSNGCHDGARPQLPWSTDRSVQKSPQLVCPTGQPVAGTPVVNATLVGLSKNAANATLYYEEHGEGDMPYPPDYPKMPGEPKRVQPSRDRDRKD